MAKQICLNPVLAALKGNFAATDEHGHKETLRFRETSWGKKYFGLGTGSKRNYTTNPITENEAAQRQAFADASALRTLIMNSATFRAQWLKRFKDQKAAGTTACNTLNGFLMQQAMAGNIADDGSYAGA